jgi:5-methylcytosine-specific restriction endonuclease McrA
MGRLTLLPTRLAPTRSERIAAPQQKVADPFYKSPEWLEARAECIARHFGFCVHCDRRPSRLFVDHIVELKDGGDPLSQSNLEPLCGSCHSVKTARARGERMAGMAGP